MPVFLRLASCGVDDANLGDIEIRFVCLAINGLNIVALVSMSPKLASSTPWSDNLLNTGIDYSEHWAKKHESKRRNIDTIQKYIDAAKLYDNDFQLKFVVQNPGDIEEIENVFLCNLTGWMPDDVVLMPEGTSTEMLADRSYWAIEAAIARGWRFTPRLHIELFGKARAV